MARRNLCPVRRSFTETPDHPLQSKDIWHYDDGTGKSLCGSPSRRNTENQLAVSCAKCLQVFKNREKCTGSILTKVDTMNNTFYCDSCGARHHTPPWRLKLMVKGTEIQISLCSACEQKVRDRITGGKKRTHCFLT